MAHRKRACAVAEEDNYNKDHSYRTLKYAVQPRDSCYLIHTTFRLTLAQLLARNKGLKCDALRANTSLDVTPVKLNPGCLTLYAINQGDTCASVKAALQLKKDLEGINPGLNCSRLLPGQQICVEYSEGDFPSSLVCRQWAPVEPRDTCAKIWARYKLEPLQFLKINPGLYCGNLLPGRASSLPGQQVCVLGGALSGGPQCKKAYKLRRGDTCASLIYNKFKRSALLFKIFNRALSCSTGSLFVNQIVCLP
eukprot:jgi/Mesen1/5163/ME000256S04345